MTIQEITLGNCASTTKTVTETDVYLFAGITGDLNPAHTNEVSASQTPFGGRIAHGILGARLHFGSPGHEAARPRDHLPRPGIEVYQARPYWRHRHGDLHGP